MTFDLTPFYKSTIGFDRFANLLDSAGALDANANGYPPYNIERTGDDAYRITMAVAGFANDDLDIEVKENTLTVTGEKTANEDGEDNELLYRGIATRSFERRFRLADYVEVTAAKLENGLLHIELKREIPDAMKPRKIEVASDVSGGGKPARKIERNAA